MRMISIAMLGAVALLAACNSGSNSAPTGQVAATVNGEEITVADLHAEMDGLRASGQTGAQLQHSALQSIITRKQIVAAAREAKLDLLPATALRQKKMDEMVLVEAFTDQIQKNVPAPSKDEAQNYINGHPASFDQRRIFVVDQLVVFDSSPKLLKKMEPINTMDGIVALLNAEHVKYNKTIGVIDALSIDPDAAEKIAALPLGAVFVSPDQDSNLRVNAVREAIVQPLDRTAAVNVALGILRSRRSNDMVQNKINEIVAAGTEKVRYNKSFIPAAGAPPSKGK